MTEGETLSPVSLSFSNSVANREQGLVTKPLNESIVFNIISNSFSSDQRIPIAKRRIHDVVCMAVPSPCNVSQCGYVCAPITFRLK